jgi:outer membrane protein assembly factor BamB
MKPYQLRRMKKPRFILLLSAVLLMSILLSGCSGTLVRAWPGLSTNENVIYLSTGGLVYAVNAENGSMVWQFPKEKPDPSKPFVAAPAFGPDGLIVVGDMHNKLYGLDSNGNKKWEFETSPIKEGEIIGQAKGNFVAPALVVDDLVLAPSSDNNLYALSLDGQLQWEYETENTLWAQPASDGELIYLPAMDHKLYALKKADGKEVWQKDLKSALLSGPVLTEDGKLIIATMEGVVTAIDLDTQNVLWSTPTEGRIWSSPVLHEGVLYVGNASNKIFAISESDGSILWKNDLGSPVLGGAAILPDGVAFPTEAGNLVAWDFQGQQQLWSKPIGGKLYTTPVATGDRLVTAVAEGENLLQAFTLDGEESWAFAKPK